MSLNGRIARLEQAIGSDEPHGEVCAAWRDLWQMVAPFVTLEYRDQIGRELRRLACRARSAVSAMPIDSIVAASCDVVVAAGLETGAGVEAGG